MSSAPCCPVPLWLEAIRSKLISCIPKCILLTCCFAAILFTTRDQSHHDALLNHYRVPQCASSRTSDSSSKYPMPQAYILTASNRSYFVPGFLQTFATATQGYDAHIFVADFDHSFPTDQDNIHVLDYSGQRFSKGSAMNDAISQAYHFFRYHSPFIVIMMDIDMRFTDRFANIVAAETRCGCQSLLFDVVRMSRLNDSVFVDATGFGISAACSDDVDRVDRRYASPKLEGKGAWGHEDYDYIERLQKVVQVTRVFLRDLLHLWHARPKTDPYYAEYAASGLPTLD